MSCFKFKQFTILQEKSAMKVGTDAVLLGSWVTCKDSEMILDVGCGTGVITLMLAQRNKKSIITAIEIDKLASKEAQLNINNSDWNNRIHVENIALQDFTTSKKFNLIISNPPYFSFNHSYERRDIARHMNTLTLEDLLSNSVNLLAEQGVLAIIIPKKSEMDFCKTARNHRLYINRVCYIKGNKKSTIKRVMIELSFLHSEIIKENLIIEHSRHNYTNKYINLCKDFYLDF